MPEQVAYALKQIFISEGGMSVEQAEQYYADMEKSRRMQQETWA